MAPPRFFVDRVDVGPVELSPDDSRHALRSLRLRPGELVTVADGRGRVGFGRLLEESQGRAIVDVDALEEVNRPSPQVSVLLAPPKGERLRWAIQKLAELGVDRTVLIRTERSIRALPSHRAEHALTRLRTTAREAAMQSRQTFIMQVEEASTAGALGESGNGSAIMLWEEAKEPLSECFPEGPSEIRLIVGPEGGFTESEVAAAREAGACMASLGRSILRTETAVVVAATLTLAHYGRLG